MVGSVFATLAGVSVNPSASLLGRFIKCRRSAEKKCRKEVQKRSAEKKCRKEVQKRSAVTGVVSEKIAVSEK